MPDNIRVVAIAFFCQTNQKYLICRRGPAESGAGQWEFPGGKIDGEETEKQALIREVYEELSLVIHDSGLVFVSDHQHQYEKRKIHIYLYKYNIENYKINFNITLIDHDQFEWVNLGEIQMYDLAGADLPFIEKLKLV